MNRRHWLWVAVGLGLALLLLTASWLVHQYYRYPRAYERLRPGASRTDVLRSFGKLDEVTGCQHEPMWDDEPINEKSAYCVQEFWYYSRMRIGNWIVGFDANDRAVTKYYASSP